MGTLKILLFTFRSITEEEKKIPHNSEKELQGIGRGSYWHSNHSLRARLKAALACS